MMEITIKHSCEFYVFNQHSPQTDCVWFPMKLERDTNIIKKQISSGKDTWLHIREYFHYMVTFEFLYHNILVEFLIINIQIIKIPCIQSKKKKEIKQQISNLITEIVSMSWVLVYLFWANWVAFICLEIYYSSN